MAPSRCGCRHAAVRWPAAARVPGRRRAGRRALRRRHIRPDACPAALTAPSSSLTPQVASRRVPARRLARSRHAVGRIHLLDLDADPLSVDGAVTRPLAGLVESRPGSGRRLVEPAETLVQAIVGQQCRSRCTGRGRITAAIGEPLACRTTPQPCLPVDGAPGDRPTALPMPRAADTLRRVSGSSSAANSPRPWCGAVGTHPSARRCAWHRPWTAQYVDAARHPDIFRDGDLVPPAGGARPRQPIRRCR